MGIKAVIFDLDNTLYSEDQYYFQVFEQFSLEYTLRFEDLKNTYLTYYEEIKSDIFSGVLEKLNFYSTERQRILFNLYQTIDARLYLYPDAESLLDYLASKNVKKAIITNGTVKAQENKIKNLNIKNKFDHITIARKFGKEREKPHALPFIFTLEQLGVTNTETVFIGDSLDTDIHGAENAGIKPVLIDTASLKANENKYSVIQNLLEVKRYV